LPVQIKNGSREKEKRRAATMVDIPGRNRGEGGVERVRESSHSDSPGKKGKRAGSL